MEVEKEARMESPGWLSMATAVTWESVASSMERLGNEQKARPWGDPPLRGGRRGAREGRESEERQRDGDSKAQKGQGERAPQGHGLGQLGGPWTTFKRVGFCFF